jgi:DNA-directed RNA polymerase specialized sigma24 family protein
VEAPDQHALDRVARSHALTSALALLSASERRLLDEHWFDERAFSEIALREGVRCSTLRVRAHRACQRLRESISVRYGAVA